jgi:hypothetical protein
VEANWLPLERKLGPANCVGFMFMGRVNGINIYKHGITRTCLYLDDKGNCYIYQGKGKRVLSDWAAALSKIEASLAQLGATLKTPYDDEFIARKQRRLRQQGISLLTISVEPHDTFIH